MSKTYGSFFSGFGVADCGAKVAGYELLFAVEYDAKIAEVYRLNLGDHIIVADIRNVDIASLPWVNHFHASPVCTRASIANKNRGECQIDIDTATATAAYIRHHLPDTVTIENVTQYREFESYRIIIRALDDCGYWHSADNLNSANFGVPQTRRRLIVRAVRGGFVPPLPEPTRWIGWYEAVEDIIDTFEPSEFAPWQMKRLPNELKTFMLNENRTSDAWVSDTDVIAADYPANTTSASMRAPRAFIVHQQMRDDILGIIQAGDSFPTVTSNRNQGGFRAFIVPGGNSSSFDIRADGIPARTVGDTERVGNMPRAFLANPSTSSDDSERYADEPANTITIEKAGAAKAFLVGDQQQQLNAQDEPSCTVRAFSGGGASPRAWLSLGRVVKISPRGLARFQSIPDWFILPDNKALACKGIGNGWPSKMAEIILKTLYDL